MVSVKGKSTLLEFFIYDFPQKNSRIFLCDFFLGEYLGWFIVSYVVVVGSPSCVLGIVKFGCVTFEALLGWCVVHYMQVYGPLIVLWVIICQTKISIENVVA